jgi:hypothetical protein
VASANLGDGDNALVAVAGTSRDEFWAVGYYKDAGGNVAHTLAEHWDGQAWAVVSSPNASGQSNYLQAVTAVAPDDVWAVGYSQQEGFGGTKPVTLTEHWDGESWSIVPSPNQGTDDENILHGVKGFAPDDVWAVGEAYADGVNVAVTLHWDGEQWVVVPGPDGGSGNWLFAVDGISPTDVWAVGYDFDDSQDSFEPLFGYWDGAAWSAYEFTSPPPLQLATTVVAISPGDVWAVGRTDNPSSEFSALFSQHWDATKWSNDLARPLAPGDFNLAVGVTALSSSDVWMSGYSTDADTKLSQPLVEHWDPTSYYWTMGDLPDVGSNAQLGTIMAVPGATQLVTVGSYTDPSDALRTLVLQNCPIQVGEAGFNASKANVDRPGATVAFSMPAGDTHRVAEISGLGLFDSGLRDPPASFTTDVFAAGTYPVADRATGAVMSLGVAPSVFPMTGGVATPFHLVWATHRTGPDRVFEVQVRRPDSADFVDLYTGHARRTTFLADDGIGAYSFKVRLVDLGSGASAHFSPIVSIAVG